ncbi:MAG: hypothetical protein HOI47_22430 [Candidatus Scalindua sp.]|jgi:hypothetical protein|nr:hypothetical protein [Candidatus Scalindua sp.]
MSEIPTWPFIIISPLLVTLGAFAVRRYITFQNASIKFHEAVLNELGDIYPNPVNWPNNTLNIKHILKTKFTNLQVAVEEFRRALPWRKRKAFAEAWLRYHCSPSYRKDKDCQEYSHYIPCTSTSIVNGKQITDETTLESCKEKFKHNIDTLLKFAKKT